MRLLLKVNKTFEPGFPQKISVDTARYWHHQLGFEVPTARKGCFLDGYECEDVLEYQKKSLKWIRVF